MADCTAVGNSMKQAITVPLNAAQNYLVGGVPPSAHLGGPLRLPLLGSLDRRGGLLTSLEVLPQTGQWRADVCAGCRAG